MVLPLQGDSSLYGVLTAVSRYDSFRGLLSNRYQSVADTKGQLFPIRSFGLIVFVIRRESLTPLRLTARHFRKGQDVAVLRRASPTSRSARRSRWNSCLK